MYVYICYPSLLLSPLLTKRKAFPSKLHFPLTLSGIGPFVAPAVTDPSLLSTTDVSATSLSSNSSS